MPNTKWKVDQSKLSILQNTVTVSARWANLLDMEGVPQCLRQKRASCICRWISKTSPGVVRAKVICRFHRTFIRGILMRIAEWMCLTWWANQVEKTMTCSSHQETTMIQCLISLVVYQLVNLVTPKAFQEDKLVSTTPPITFQLKVLRCWINQEEKKLRSVSKPFSEGISATTGRAINVAILKELVIYLLKHSWMKENKI